MSRAGRLACLPAALLAVVAAACAGRGAGESGAHTVSPRQEVPVLGESFTTPRDTADNIDSAAIWHGPDGQHWLLATAKTTDVVVVSDAATGRVLRRVGGEGTAPGRLDRPNGIAVVDDLAFVVERDNRRVQVFSLPEFAPVGAFGAGELRKPYGIALVREEKGSYVSYVTDNYELGEDVLPPDSLLGERVRQYRVRVDGSALRAEPLRAFGDARGRGVLRVVESIAADLETGRLLIAEEQEGASMIKVYNLEGRFTGEIIDSRFFPHQAEGIVLYACGLHEGYWITTDQGEEVNTFHLFDRRSLAHVGSFRARGVRNTDGIALTQASFGGFPAGAFYAVHDDGSVAAIGWPGIARELGLRRDCAPA